MRASKNSDKAAVVKTVQNCVVRSPSVIRWASIAILLGFLDVGPEFFAASGFLVLFLKKVQEAKKLN
jgi:hypothetical protein